MNDRLLYVIENEIDTKRIRKQLEWEMNTEKREKLEKVLEALQIELDELIGNS